MSAMLKESEAVRGETTWGRALGEVVEALVDCGQYPREGRASVKRAELLPEDFEFRAFEDLMLQTNKDALYAEQRRIKDAADAILRDRIQETGYRWIVDLLADDIERNANADRWEDEE